MSKSGSRYGRRSNWFKIHCLLQEQQQAASAAAAAAGSIHKTPSPSTGLSMLNHHQNPPYPRPTCTKEELMLLGFDEYPQPKQKPSSASPSVSSPDSHNSDSSLEIGDRRQLMRQTQASSVRDHHAPAPGPAFNKDLFLPLSFPGLMHPPAFLPPSHLMFPGYHPALYAQHQGLLKPAIDPTILMNTMHSLGNNNTRFAVDHNNSKTTEELTKHYLNAMLKTHQHATANNQNQNGNNGRDDCGDQMMESDEAVAASMTPPRSPPCNNNVARGDPATPTRLCKSLKSSLPSQSQEIPIDLSMKNDCYTITDGARLLLSPNGAADSDHSTTTDIDDVKSIPSSSPTPINSLKRSPSTKSSIGDQHSANLCDNENNVIDEKPLIASSITPLDLTTRV